MADGFMLQAVILFVGTPTTPLQADFAYICACIFSVFGIFLLFAILSFAFGVTRRLAEA